MKYSFKDGIFILDAFGCYVKVENGIIYTAAINADNSCDYDWVEVTDPAPNFLEALRFN